ncbi:MAG: DUF4349 domain-containing protein [Chloroflexota bacterium]
MNNNLSHQSRNRYWTALLLLLLALAISACAAAAPATPAVMGEAPPQEMAAEVSPGEQEIVSNESKTEAEAASAPVEGSSPASDRPNVYNRLIIKNAEVELRVENTDTAINRSLGIVTDYGGYVISNRTWFQGELKYATLTIGVPAENFEEMLRRLKDLAISVTNETASGQDVTDEFVDLESRLRNLEATAARIRNFLDQAQTVEESLTVSAQLSAIEAEIEQVKGRMAYLRDRAAFSTITLQISPQPPQPEPTPAPTPTPTPEPWSVSRTFNDATGVTSRTAASLFQVAVDLAIWLVVVILPFTLPLVGLIWAGIWLVRRLGASETLRPPSP